MNWDAVGAISELVGAVAVIVTLIYLALQIRQNNALLRSQSRQAQLSNDQTSLTVAFDHIDILQKLSSDTPLTPDEQTRLSIVFLTTLASVPLITARAIFFAPPQDAIVDWHPAPHRQLNIVLSGTIEVEVADGEKRVFAPGDVLLLEDVDGKGHRTVVGSNEDTTFVTVELD